MHTHEINVFIGPLGKGGDSAGQRIFLGFSLLTNGEGVISDFLLDGEKLDMNPEELIDLVPVGIFNACPLGATICVTRGLARSP